MMARHVNENWYIKFPILEVTVRISSDCCVILTIKSVKKLVQTVKYSK